MKNIPIDAHEIGYAVDIHSYLVLINGLPNARINEMVLHSTGARGLVTALRDDMVEVIMLDDAKIKPQDTFTRTNQQFSLAPGNHYLGRTISPVGVPIDGKAPFPKMDVTTPVDQQPVGIVGRQFITEQFPTGVAVVDMLVPLARGQRQLLIGDARAGKTGFLIDTIVNQKDQQTICVLALIGKPVVEIRKIVDILTTNHAMEYTTVIAASSSELASLIYLTAYSGFAVAEFFQKQGKNVLLVLDDMGLHAQYYREVALLANRTPGRDSYPGDIFFQHAKLMERAGRFTKEAGGGSITALPVIETSPDNVTSFIPTNLMAMTDGHWIFDSQVYHQGTRPAIDISLSVSRVGRQTQILIEKELSDKIKSIMAQASRLEAFARLGTDLSAETQQTLHHSRQLKVLLNQPPLTNIPQAIQIVLLSLSFTPYLRSKSIEFITSNREALITLISTRFNLQQLQSQLMAMTTLDQLWQFANQIVVELSRKQTNANR